MQPPELVDLRTVHEPRPAAASGRVAHALWGRGFRPFFLATGLYGCAVVAVWTAMALGGLPAPAWLVPMWWHGHEMLFGVVMAAIAGFLLTATPVWTGRPAVQGRPLMALVASWALGRIAMWAAGVLPAALVAAADLAFPAALAGVLARTVWGTGQRRNYGVIALVGLLALANAAVHAQALGLSSSSAPRGLRFAVHLAVLLIVVIGGRITPAFTTNALLRLGIEARARSHPWLDRAAIASVLLVAAADLLAPRTLATGIVAALAALAVGARMAGWQTRHTRHDPLVWSLHAGMAWVVVGLALVAASDLGAPIAPSAALHALTAGAMGSMILAVMTRVGLGHTGRPLALPPYAVSCYWLVHAGATARVASGLAPAAAAPLLVIGGVLWAAGFGLFAVLYAPILTRPRVDGREG